MDGAALISLLRGTTGTDSGNYPDADAVTDLNLSYHGIEETVTKVAGEKYFWDRMDTTGVDSQSEYSFDSSVTGNMTGIKKTYWVSVDYGWTGDFKRATRIDTDLLERDASYYETNASKEEPMYEIRDDSLFIYPAPTDGVSIIRHSASRNLVDLTASTAEDDVFNGRLPKSCHYAIAMGARRFAFLRQRREDLAEKARSDFETTDLPKVISYCNTRDVSAKERNVPAGFRVNPL